MDGFRFEAGANLFLETYATVRQVAQELGVPFERTRLPINAGVYNNGKFLGIYGGGQLVNRLRLMWTYLTLRVMTPKALLQGRRFQGILRAPRHADFRRCQRAAGRR